MKKYTDNNQELKDFLAIFSDIDNEITFIEIKIIKSIFFEIYFLCLQDSVIFLKYRTVS